MRALIASSVADMFRVGARLVDPCVASQVKALMPLMQLQGIHPKMEKGDFDEATNLAILGIFRVKRERERESK